MIRTVVEVNGRTAFKLYPKSGAGRRTIPLPDWLLPILRDHIARYRAGRAGLIFPNQVGIPLRRTLFCARAWRPTLVRAGLLGIITETNSTVDGRTATAPPGPPTLETPRPRFSAPTRRRLSMWPATLERPYRFMIWGIPTHVARR